MPNLVDLISQAESYELNDLMNAIVARYSELFPTWHIHTISIEDGVGKNEQIDRIIDYLNRLRDAT